MNPLYNRFNNMFSQPRPPQNNSGLGNLLAQLRQAQQNPQIVLDLMLQNGKISQQQYNEMKQLNNPQQWAQYLAQSGYSAEINQAQQQASGLNI